MDYVRRTAVRVELGRIKRDLEQLRQYLDPENGRRELCIYSEPGAAEPIYSCSGAKGAGTEHAREYTELTPQFRGTYIAEVVGSFPAKWKRARIMLVDPGKCYEMHYDEELRYHLAIETNRGAWLLYEDGKSYHIPADGYFYEMDARIRHTAFNAGQHNRIHIVLTGFPLAPLLSNDETSIPLG